MPVFCLRANPTEFYAKDAVKNLTENILIGICSSMMRAKHILVTFVKNLSLKEV